MNRLGLIALSAALIALTSCATMFTRGGKQYRDGERALEAGDYVSAASLAIDALDKNAEFEEARSLLSRAFNQGTARWEAAVSDLESSGEQFAYDSIYPLYEKLEALHSTVGDSMHGADFDVERYADRIADAREKAADAHYQAAIAALEKGDFRSARNAVREFNVVQRIVPDFKDAAALQDKARELATVTLMVYADGEPSGLFGESFGRQVVGAAGVATFTEVVNGSSLAKAATFEEVIARADGADFVLYVTGLAGGAAYGPEQGAPKEFYPATIGYELSVGYESAVDGSFRLYDVAAGKTVAGNSVEVESSDSITMRVFEPTSSREYTLVTDGGEVTGTFDVLDSSVDATGIDWAKSEIGSVITETGAPYAQDGVAVCIPEIDLDELRSASFTELRSMLDGKAILPGVEVLFVPELAALAIYRYTEHYEADGAAVMEEYSAKATEIVTYFRDNAVELAQQRVESGIDASAAAAVQIGLEVAPILQ